MSATSLITLFAFSAADDDDDDDKTEVLTEKVMVRRRRDIDKFWIDERGRRSCVIASLQEGQCMLETSKEKVGRWSGSSDMADEWREVCQGKMPGADAVSSFKHEIALICADIAVQTKDSVSVDEEGGGPAKMTQWGLPAEYSSHLAKRPPLSYYVIAHWAGKRFRWTRSSIRAVDAAALRATTDDDTGGPMTSCWWNQGGVSLIVLAVSLRIGLPRVRPDEGVRKSSTSPSPPV